MAGEIKEPRGVSDAAIQGSAGEAVPRLVRIPAEKPGAAVAFLQARSRGVMDLIAHFWERLAATPPLQRQDLHLLLAADTSGSVDMQMSTEINALRGAMLYVPKAHRADVLALDARAAQAFAAYIVHRGADAAGGGAGSNGGAEPAKRGNGSAEATSPPVAPTQGTALPTAATHPAVGTAPEIQLLDYSTGGPPGGGAATGIAAINGTPLPPSQRVAIDFITGGAEGIEWLVPVLLPAVHRRAPARQMVNMVMQLPAEAACEAAPEVRAAREADVPVLNRWRRAYREERGILFDADLDAWVATGRVFVSEAGGQVVAVAKLDVELPELVEIGGVYTFPDHRQRGYGSRLVADLACRIRAMKKVPTLQVDVENGPALRLYEAAGWVRRGRLARVWLTG